MHKQVINKIHAGLCGTKDTRKLACIIDVLACRPAVSAEFLMHWHETE